MVSSSKPMIKDLKSCDRSATGRFLRQHLHIESTKPTSALPLTTISVCQSDAFDERKTGGSERLNHHKQNIVILSQPSLMDYLDIIIADRPMVLIPLVERGGRPCASFEVLTRQVCHLLHLDAVARFR
jgi:hypothetical protein